MVGASTVANADHAFLYSGGAMIDLGTLGGSWSTALGISDTGQVVGRSATADGTEHAFIAEERWLTLTPFCHHRLSGL